VTKSKIPPKGKILGILDLSSSSKIGD